MEIMDMTWNQLRSRTRKQGIRCLVGFEGDLPRGRKLLLLSGRLRVVYGGENDFALYAQHPALDRIQGLSEKGLRIPFHCCFDPLYESPTTQSEVGDVQLVFVALQPISTS